MCLEMLEQCLRCVGGIEDPFGAGLDAYQRTFVQLERAIMGLMERLEPILSP